MIALLIAAALALPTPSPTPGPASNLATAATVLRSDPVYVAPAEANTIDIVAVQQAVRSVPLLRVAVLPAAAAAEAGGDAAAVPGELSARIGRGGTVLVLLGNDLEAASSTLGPTDVQDSLAVARPLLHSDSASRTAAVTAAVRLLSNGSGRGLGEASSPAPRSAGNPSGISGLIALAVLVIAGLAAVLVLPWLRRRRPAVPPPPPRRTVYVDTFGRVTGVRRAEDPVTTQDPLTTEDPVTTQDAGYGDTAASPPADTSDRPSGAAEED